MSARHDADPEPVLGPFAAAALGGGSRAAVDGPGGRLDWTTYGAAVREAALGFAAAGIGAGTAVDVAGSGDAADRAVAVLAVLSCGGVVAVGDAGADVVVGPADLARHCAEGRRRDAADPEAYEVRSAAVRARDVAVIAAGTEGGAPTTFRHVELAWAVRSLGGGLGLGRRDVVATCVPDRPDLELVLLLATAATGATWVPIEDDADVVAVVRDRSPTVVWARPTSWLQLAAEHEVGPRRRSPLTAALHLPTRRRRAALGLGACRWAVSDGTPEAETASTLADAGVALAGSWGATVALGLATVDDPVVPSLGSVGRPLPGVEVGVGAEGTLALRAAHAAGAGWHETGVVGSVASDGRVRVGDRARTTPVSGPA